MKTSLLKFFVFLLTASCFVACATQPGKVITMDSYLQVENGETREDILREFGEPLTIELKDDGTEIFTYIERFFMNGKVIEAHYYYFYIKGGKVVGKLVKTEDRPQSINSDDF
ncbi:MAG: hypothetical protein SP4CHLAM5_07820 [Chlamydiia bacterium]|nr:hypothetical protein [Chlamydiia bacterium]MCH9618646.1 hypothetical protein [Chlamydiia bacterium]MCH9623837.1 hypothetical protein [Chlamydiia bacterium]